MIGLLDQTLQELTNLVERFLRAEAAELDDHTMQRFHQAEDLPDYALGDLSEVEPAADANVTASMETGQTVSLDLPIDTDTIPPRDGGS
jgi:hypothetical protein